MTNPVYNISPATHLEEAQAYQRLCQQCFHVPVVQGKSAAEQVGLENLWLVRDQDQVIGGLKLYRMAQWLGGRRVPMAGVAAVAIAPEYRGVGLAYQLMQQVLERLQTEGIALSTLYAATQRLYRKVGYEPAGTYCRFAVPAQGLTPLTHNLPVVRIDPNDLNEAAGLQTLYEQRAQSSPGNLSRHPALWDSLRQAADSLYAYRFGTLAQPEGYVIFTQSGPVGNYNLNVRDLVCLTPAAAQRFWTFCADHRSLADQILWHGPALEPLLLLLPEQTYRIVHLERWLTRIVSVVPALTARGYNAALDTELHLDLRDALLPANQGRWRLMITKGQAQVEPGGDGTLQLDVRGLAALYTGFLTAFQLQEIGYLSGSTQALEAATQIFAGAEPWMPDHF